jgi:hypothetical protein
VRVADPGVTEVRVQPERDERRVLQRHPEVFLLDLEFALERCAGASLRYRLSNPVQQQRELKRPGTLLDVVGHAGVDRLLGDFLVPLAREEDERQFWPPLADRVEQFESVRPGHLVVADYAVDVVRFEMVENVVGVVHRVQRDVVVVLDDEAAQEIREQRVVVDVNHRNR